MSRLVMPVLICPGSIEGLWPLSDDDHPIELLELFAGQSLFARALALVGDATDADPQLAPPIIATRRRHEALVSAQLSAAGIAPGLLILARHDRGSLPLAGLAAIAALERDEEALLLLLPVDRHIPDAPALLAAIEAACPAAAEGWPILFLSATLPAGLALIRADRLLALIANHMPDVARAIRKSFDAAGRRAGQLLPEPISHGQSPSCDLGMLLAPEQIEEMQLVEAGPGIMRIDGWPALHRLAAGQGAGNMVSAHADADGCTGSLLLANGMRLVALGLEDLIVACSGNILLVSTIAASDRIGQWRDPHPAQEAKLP